MKVLVIGKGGREHALVHAVSRSGRVRKIYAREFDTYKTHEYSN